MTFEHNLGSLKKKWGEEGRKTSHTADALVSEISVQFIRQCVTVSYGRLLLILVSGILTKCLKDCTT